MDGLSSPGGLWFGHSFMSQGSVKGIDGGVGEEAHVVCVDQRGVDHLVWAIMALTTCGSGS